MKEEVYEVAHVKFQLVKQHVQDTSLSKGAKLHIAYIYR